MNNYYTPWDTNTQYKPTSMNGVPSALDKALTYLKNVMVFTAGNLSFDAGTGVLAWTSQISVLFAREDGNTIRNNISAGSLTIGAGQFAYCDLSETDGQTISMYTATPTTAQASNFLAVPRLVMGYRDSAGGFFPVNLIPPLGSTVDVKRSVTVKEAVTQGQLLCLKADGYYKADNTSIATCQDIVVALQSGSADTQAVVMERGEYAGASGLTVGGAVYVGTAGGFTQTAPSGTGKIVKCIGWATAATKIKFVPDTLAVELA